MNTENQTETPERWAERISGECNDFAFAERTHEQYSKTITELARVKAQADRADVMEKALREIKGLMFDSTDQWAGSVCRTVDAALSQPPNNSNGTARNEPVQKCSWCSGTGLVDDEHPHCGKEIKITCYHCGGSGNERFPIKPQPTKRGDATSQTRNGPQA